MQQPILSIISVMGSKSFQPPLPIRNTPCLVLCPIHPTILPLAHSSLTREIQILLLPLPKQFSSPAPRGANTKAFHCPGPTLLSRHLWWYVSFFPAALMDWDWSSHKEASAYIWVTYLTYIVWRWVFFLFAQVKSCCTQWSVTGWFHST